MQSSVARHWLAGIAALLAMAVLGGCGTVNWQATAEAWKRSACANNANVDCPPAPDPTRFGS